MHPRRTNSFHTAWFAVSGISLPQMGSFGQAFHELLHVNFGRSQVHRSSMFCMCKKQIPVYYDSLNKVQLREVCKMKKINATGPRPALVMRLMLHEEWTGLATCRQCMMTLPLRPSDKASSKCSQGRTAGQSISGPRTQSHHPDPSTS